MTKTKLTCGECGGGLDASDLAYGLVCPVCDVRVAGPFTDAHDIPDYESVSDQTARYANEARECEAEDRAERHGEDDRYDDRARYTR